MPERLDVSVHELVLKSAAHHRDLLRLSIMCVPRTTVMFDVRRRYAIEEQESITCLLVERERTWSVNGNNQCQLRLTATDEIDKT